MTDNLPEMRRALYKVARQSDQPPVVKRYAEMMIAQIDSRRSEHPFVDQLAHSHRLLTHKTNEGTWPDHSAEHIAQALGLQNNDDRGGVEALSEDGRLFDVYPNAIVTEGQSAEVNGSSPDCS